MKKDSLLYTVIFAFITAFVFVLGLAFANEATKETVKINNNKASSRAVLNALNIRYNDGNVLDIFDSLEKLDENLIPLGDDLSFQEQLESVRFYRYTAAGTSGTFYAVPFSGSGLWGTIQGVLGISADLDSVSGIEIISHNETPGLGGRIDDAWYKTQYIGEDISGGSISLTTTPGTGDESRTNSQVDGITGATRTSESMIIIVNNTITRLRDALGGTK